MLRLESLKKTPMRHFSFTYNKFSQSKADQACTQANSMCGSDPKKQKCVMSWYKSYVDGACDKRIGKKPLKYFFDFTSHNHFFKKFQKFEFLLISEFYFLK